MADGPKERGGLSMLHQVLSENGCASCFVTSAG